MSLGLHDPERRYRRRIWGAITRIGFYIVTLVVASVFAYQSGVQQVISRENQLTEDVAALEQTKATLEQNAIRLEAAARTAQRQYDELLARFEREVPTGVARDFAELVAERLAAGVPPERLAFYIGAADEAKDCIDTVTKRFIMPTPIYDGPNTSIGFSDGRITVTGRGQNAVADGGGPLGWYDPAREVSLNFTVIGGETSTVTGLLPLHTSVVLDGWEHRFTAVEGERSFVQVTGDRCPLAG
ncbi:MAG: hypothetical protein ACTS3R_00040 [Inquilinaceae bacterium]